MSATSLLIAAVLIGIPVSASEPAEDTLIDRLFESREKIVSLHVVISENRLVVPDPLKVSIVPKTATYEIWMDGTDRRCDQARTAISVLTGRKVTGFAQCIAANASFVSFNKAGSRKTPVHIFSEELVDMSSYEVTRDFDARFFGLSFFDCEPAILAKERPYDAFNGNLPNLAWERLDQQEGMTEHVGTGATDVSVVEFRLVESAGGDVGLRSFDFNFERGSLRYRYEAEIAADSPLLLPGSFKFTKSSDALDIESSEFNITELAINEPIDSTVFDHSQLKIVTGRPVFVHRETAGRRVEDRMIWNGSGLVPDPSGFDPFVTDTDNESHAVPVDKNRIYFWGLVLISVVTATVLLLRLSRSGQA